MVATPNSDRLVTVFGGSGFIGRHLVRTLARRDFRIRIATRRPDLVGHLQPLGRVGQIMPVAVDLGRTASVERATDGAFAVVNLVGILAESGRHGFEAVHVDGARSVAEAARKAGVERFVQQSAIGADAQSESAYGRSKAQGEEAVRAIYPDAVVTRPSIVFGPEDKFFNRFAGMARLSPVMPLISGDTRFQPVFVGDVADAIAKAVDGEAQPGTTYELGGPDIRTFEELMRLMLRITDRRRPLLPVPDGIARLQAKILQYMPGSPLTPDQLAMLHTDNIVSDAARAEGRTLEDLGIQPRAMEVILPTYLNRFRKTGQFNPARTG